MTETGTIRLPHVPDWRSWSPAEVLERCPETGRPLRARLSTGHVVEYARERGDAVRAALASLAGVPFEDVPAVDEEMAGWARTLGCRLLAHDIPPVHRMAWVGLAPGPDAALMCKSHVTHNPLAYFPMPVPIARHIGIDDITAGLTLEPLEGC